MAIVKGALAVAGAWFIVSCLFVLAYSSLKMYALRRYARCSDNELIEPSYQAASVIFQPARAVNVPEPAAFSRGW